MVAVSVVVPVVDDFEQLKNLVRSLDLQTLRSEDFEVVLRAVDGQSEVDQFAVLAAHRPNVKVLRTADQASDLLSAVEGDFVLLASQDETLFPSALARLHDFAEQHGLDAVLGRVVAPGRAVPAQLWTDADVVTDVEAVTALSNPAEASPARLFVRRSTAKLTESGLLVTPGTRGGILGSQAVVRRGGPPATSSAEVPASSAPALTVETVEWQGGSLHLVLQTAGTNSASGKPRAAIQLRHADTSETLLVPAEISTNGRSGGPSSDGSPSLGLHIEAAITPTGTPLGGQSLAAGRWHVELLLATDGDTRLSGSVPWSPCPPALIGTTGVVPAPTTTAGGPASLTLDVGPKHHPLLTDLDPAEGTITESVVGSELVLNLPQLQVFDSDGLDGALALGRMRIPARICVRDTTHAQLVALVSGLAGKTVLSAQFGPGPLRPTGLSLQITGLGAMSLIKTPPAPARPPSTPSAPKPAPTNKAPNSAQPKRRKKRKKVEPPRTGVVADLRRAVPAPLEPAVKRLATIPAARRLYRRVTR